MIEQIESIKAHIKTAIGERNPEIAIILGSGLGALGEEISDPIYIDYNSLSGFPQSTVSGHQGRFISGELEGKQVLCMQGRVHLYEGHSPSDINLIIKILQIIGIKTLVVTNAAGSLNPKLKPGSIMLIKDHINFSGRNPLVGPNDEDYGPRFPDVSNAYTDILRQKVKEIAKSEKISLKEGVYLMVLGPNFETAAEIRAFQILGADAVGMSTVPEVIAAAHSNINVLGLSVITNFGTGLKVGPQSHTETLHQAQIATHDLTTLVKRFIAKE